MAAVEAGLAGVELVDCGAEVGLAGIEAVGVVAVAPGLQVGQLRVALPEPPPPQATKASAGVIQTASRMAARVIPEFKRTEKLL